MFKWSTFTCRFRSLRIGHETIFLFLKNRRITLRYRITSAAAAAAGRASEPFTTDFPRAWTRTRRREDRIGAKYRKSLITPFDIISSAEEAAVIWGGQTLYTRGWLAAITDLISRSLWTDGRTADEEWTVFFCSEKRKDKGAKKISYRCCCLGSFFSGRPLVARPPIIEGGQQAFCKIAVLLFFAI